MSAPSVEGPPDDPWSSMMKAAIAGDEGVYRRLLEEIGRSVRAMARAAFARARIGRRRCRGCGAGDFAGDPSEAPHLGPEPEARPWVNAIARHKIIDAMRRRGARRAEPIEDFEDFLAAPAEEDPHALSDAKKLIETLSPRQRDIVRSISLDGQSIAATAARLSMTEVAVRVALHRALKSLGAAWRSSVVKSFVVRTSELIAALAADPVPEPVHMGRRFARRGWRWAFSGRWRSTPLFVGPRPDFAEAVADHPFRSQVRRRGGARPAVAHVCSFRLARPDARPGALALWLFAPLVLLAAAVAVELMVVPPGEWMARLVGDNWMYCSTMIPMMAAPILAALIVAMRAGAPLHPGWTGALAGAASAGAAALLYASHCTDDSPLFVATWYPLATLVCAGAGALLGRRFLAW